MGQARPGGFRWELKLKPGREGASGETWCEPVGPERTLGGFSPQRPRKPVPSPLWKLGACWHLPAASELLKSLGSQCLAMYFSETLGCLGLENEA